MGNHWQPEDQDLNLALALSRSNQSNGGFGGQRRYTEKTVTLGHNESGVRGADQTYNQRLLQAG